MNSEQYQSIIERISKLQAELLVAKNNIVKLENDQKSDAQQFKELKSILEELNTKYGEAIVYLSTLSGFIKWGVRVGGIVAGILAWAKKTWIIKFFSE